MKALTVLLFTLLICFSGYATTWDEPWQEDIIKEAEYFVLAKILISTDSLVKIEIEKSFGAKLSGEIIIDGFFMLDICSFSGGHGPEFHIKENIKSYFFLKKGKNGNYEIPTPTSGFAEILDGTVYATYRHSYHQAGLQPKDYELTYQEIWNQYHSTGYDEAKVMDFINLHLSKEPAGFEEEEINIFFQQHAALETAYLLGIELDFELLKKFAESVNFHTQVSAFRAMSKLNTENVKEYLLTSIQDEEKDNFVKVIAIWSLSGMEDEKYIKQLLKLEKQLSDEDTGFGGNIMDPRVCTYFPTPKGAIQKLKEKK